MKNFFLKARIVEKFGNQCDFARLVGISEDRLSKYIHGRLVPGERDRQIIAQKLGASASVLFPSETVAFSACMEGSDACASS